MSFHPFTRYKTSALSLHLHFPTPGCFSSGQTQAQPSAEQEFALTVRALLYVCSGISNWAIHSWIPHEYLPERPHFPGLKDIAVSSPQFKLLKALLHASVKTGRVLTETTHRDSISPLSDSHTWVSPLPISKHSPENTVHHTNKKNSPVFYLMQSKKDGLEQDGSDSPKPGRLLSSPFSLQYLCYTSLVLCHSGLRRDQKKAFK